MGKALTKDIVQSVASKKNMTLKEAEEYVDAFFSIVTEGLQRDNVVKIKGFGTFKLIEVRDRESIDVNTGERMIIEGHTKMTFTPDSTLRDMVNKPFSQFETVVVNDGVKFDELVLNESNVDENSTESLGLTEKVDVLKGRENDNTNGSFVVTHGEKTTPIQTELQVIDSGDGTASISESQECNDTFSDNDKVLNSEEVSGKNELHGAKGFTGLSISADEPKEDIASSTDLDGVEKNNSQDGDITSSQIKNQCSNSYDEEKEKTNNRKSLLFKILLTLTFLFVVVVVFFAGYFYANSKQSGSSGKTEIVSNENIEHVKTSNSAIGPNVKSKNTRKDLKTAQLNKEKNKTINGSQVIQNVAIDDKKNIVSQSVKDKESILSSAIDKNSQSNADNNINVSASDKRLLTAKRFVETGAYRIVGTERTYTVKAGDTMSSIARRFLGMGMECYIQVYNQTCQTNEGAVLKIPRLELKRKR